MPTTLIGKEQGSKSDKYGIFPLEPSSDEENYVVSAKAIDYKFEGSLTVIKEGFELSSRITEQISADQLDVFSNENFKIQGTLTSKLNPNYTVKGEIEVKDEKILVDGQKPTHGVKAKELEVMVFKIDEENRPTQLLYPVTELPKKTTRLSIQGHLQGPCRISKVHGLWKAKAEVYQLPVFCSTLTKHMYLTKVGTFFIKYVLCLVSYKAG